MSFPAIPHSDPKQQAAQIGTRIDRLRATRSIWKLVILLSLGGSFEMYDLLLVGYVSPGLIRGGIFHTGKTGFFGLTDQATFVSMTFAGLFLGTIALGYVADRFGRRIIFTVSLLWYAAATAVMAAQYTAITVFLWRFVAGIGIGVALVTIDAYISELVPKSVRGRAFAINQCVQFSALPVLAFIAWQLVPRQLFGIAGWRWVVAVPALGLIFVWWIIRFVPESPRWLAEHGRIEEAERITAGMEARVLSESGAPLPEPQALVIDQHHHASFADIFRPPYRRRTIMLAVFNFFQAIAFYGFGNWLPALMAERGANFTQSLQYSFLIAISYPFGPLIFTLFADRFERKWQIVTAACSTAIFGLLFSVQSKAVMLVALGLLITMSNNLLSYSYHAYMAELFPTRVRARAVGFVYSFSRISTAITSFMIAFFLQNFGGPGVFGFIAFSMIVVVISIGIFGPRTRGLSLEEISRG